MINLIKMNFYRMFHTNSTYILLIVIFAFSCFSSVMADLDREKVAEAVNDVAGSETLTITEADDETTFGITVDSPVHEDGSEPAFFEYVCADLQSGILLIFLSIFTVLFVNGEEKSGFDKNIAGQFRGKYYIYLSKIVAIFGFNLIGMAAYMAGQFLFFFIYHKGEDIGFSIFGEVFLYIVIQWLLIGGFMSGLACFTTIIKNSAVSITFAMLIACGMSRIFTGFIYKLLDRIDIKNVILEKYFLSDTIKSISYLSTEEKLLSAFLLAVAFICIYNIIGSAVVQKRDM